MVCNRRNYGPYPPFCEPDNLHWDSDKGGGMSKFLGALFEGSSKFDKKN